MSEKTAKDSHYARLRRQHRDNKHYREGDGCRPQTIQLYGLHTVAAALANPKRQKHRLMVTQNAYGRLELDTKNLDIEPEFCQPRQLDQLLGADAVHQGVLLEAMPLKTRALSDIGHYRLVVVLDQVSDPHNIGALMRSSVAFGAGAIITTTRHSAQESGVLAKAASGALEMIDTIAAHNLAQALQQLHALGFTSVGLDSAATAPLEEGLKAEKLALVLGNEGKGLRAKTRQTVTRLARLDMPGAIKSLNVSNAGALALYIANRHLKDA